MTYQRLAYDDPDTRPQMSSDCQACSTQFPRQAPGRRVSPEQVGRPAPSLHYDDFPDEIAKREISIDQATAHLADRMHLHLD